MSGSVPTETWESCDLGGPAKMSGSVPTETWERKRARGHARLIGAIRGYFERACFGEKS